MRLDPERTAVTVVDMQHGFCHPDGSLYAPASEAAIERVNEVVAGARAAGAPVIWTRDVHPSVQFEDAHYYDEFERWGEHVVEGTWDAAFVEGLDVRDEDHLVEKHTYDAFYRTDLEGYLDAHGLDTLVICGTLANVCVLHTAGSAGLRDIRPVVVSDALGYIEAAHRDYTVAHVEWLFGETATVDELAWGRIETTAGADGQH